MIGFSVMVRPRHDGRDARHCRLLPERAPDENWVRCRQHPVGPGGADQADGRDLPPGRCRCPGPRGAGGGGGRWALLGGCLAALLALIAAINAGIEPNLARSSWASRERPGASMAWSRTFWRASVLGAPDLFVFPMIGLVFWSRGPVSRPPPERLGDRRFRSRAWERRGSGEPT